MTVTAEEAARLIYAGERAISFNTLLARIGGSLQAGLFMSQLMYWTPKGRDEDGWIYKKYAEWHEETTMTRREIDGARKAWRDLGVLEESQRFVTDRTMWYRVNFDALVSLLPAFACVRNVHMEVTETVTSNGTKRSLVQYKKLLQEKTTENRVGATARKPKGADLGPLVDAFRAVKIADPKFVGYAEVNAAQELMRNYSLDEIAQCWSDIETGTYGSPWDHEHLSFSTLASSNRIGNWQRWNSAGRKPQGGQHERTTGRERTSRGPGTPTSPPPGERPYAERERNLW